MNRFLYIAFLLFGSFNFCQSQIIVVGHIFAEVVENLTITEEAQLNFGRFAPMESGGSVIVAPDGVRTSSGDVTLTPGNSNAGSFYVTGQKLAYFTLNLPTEQTIISNSGSSKTMVVKDWVCNANGSVKYSLSENGTQQVTIGATLMVNSLPENPRGLYTGSYVIRFDYN